MPCYLPSRFLQLITCIPYVFPALFYPTDNYRPLKHANWSHTKSHFLELHLSYLVNPRDGYNILSIFDFDSAILKKIYDFISFLRNSTYEWPGPFEVVRLYSPSWTGNYVLHGPHSKFLRHRHRRWLYDNPSAYSMRFPSFFIRSWYECQ